MARGEVLSEAGGWIQVPMRADTSAASAQNRRRSAAAIAASGAAVCLAIVVIVVVSNGGQSNDVLFTKDLKGKDPELATINRALALETAHTTELKTHSVKLAKAPSSGKPENHQSLTSAGNSGDKDSGKGSPKESFSVELHNVETEYSKEIKAAKIKTMEKLQHEEKAALDAVHTIKDQGNADVEKLMKAEKKTEGVIRAKEEEAELDKQLQQVETDAARRKQAIQAKINAIHVSVLKLHDAEAGGGQMKSKTEEAPKHEAQKAQTSQIEKLEHEVAALHAKKVAVRAKVHQVEQQEEKERALSEKKAQKDALPVKQAASAAIEPAAPSKPAAPPKPAVEAAAPKPKKHGYLCTANNCDIRAEDKSLVTNGESIHQLSEVLDGDNDGSRKERALEEVKALQEQIRDDYKHVQNFAYHQEHELDQVKRQTAKELGHEVVLKVERSMGAQHPMILQDSIPEDEKM